MASSNALPNATNKNAETEFDIVQFLTSVHETKDYGALYGQHFQNAGITSLQEVLGGNDDGTLLSSCVATLGKMQACVIIGIAKREHRPDATTHSLSASIPTPATPTPTPTVQETTPPPTKKMLDVNSFLMGRAMLPREAYQHLPLPILNVWGEDETKSEILRQMRDGTLGGNATDGVLGVLRQESPPLTQMISTLSTILNSINGKRKAFKRNGCPIPSYFDGFIQSDARPTRSDLESRQVLEGHATSLHRRIIEGHAYLTRKATAQHATVGPATEFLHFYKAIKQLKEAFEKRSAQIQKNNAQQKVSRSRSTAESQEKNRGYQITKCTGQNLQLIRVTKAVEKAGMYKPVSVVDSHNPALDACNEEVMVPSTTRSRRSRFREQLLYVLIQLESDILVLCTPGS